MDGWIQSLIRQVEFVTFLLFLAKAYFRVSMYYVPSLSQLAALSISNLLFSYEIKSIGP